MSSGVLSASVPWLPDFEVAEEHSHWAEHRAVAMDTFQRRGIPTTRDEEWKYTSLRALADQRFARPKHSTIDEQAVTPFLPAGLDATRLVFINGKLDAKLSSSIDGIEGIDLQLVSSASLSTKQNSLIAGTLAVSEFPFANLNAALFEEVLLLQVHQNCTVSAPIHILWVHTVGSQHAVFPRMLIRLDAGSKLQLVESHCGLEQSQTFASPVTIIDVAEAAHLEYIKVQEESLNSYHLALAEARVLQDATFIHFNINFGGLITRNDINVVLDGKNVHCRLDGVVVQHGNQHCDTHSRLDHAMPHCDSFEVYKHVLRDHAAGVFNGKIFVHQDAQKTDAKQTNQTLLLSDAAAMFSKPQLEIFADDVKCTHGATIGQLRQDAMFYLRSRGISLEDARALLVYAFAAEVLEKISVEPVRQHLEARLLAKLKEG